MKYRGIFEYEYPTEHKTPVGIDVYLHGDCVKGKIIEWEYRPLEQEPTIKNDLAVDCIDRVELLKAMNTYDKFGNDSNERLVFLSTPALQDRYVPYVHYDEMVNCVKGMPTVTPQEPRKLEQEQDKPMVEIDLYSVIKQKYIECDVLGKIRAEIKTMSGDIETIADVLQIIDKYKAESEG